MTQKPDSLAFRFGVVLAVAAIVLAIITWAAPSNSESAAAEPIPPREVIYRPQHLNLYRRVGKQPPWNELPPWGIWVRSAKN
jgi:hypothetical protein